MSSKDLELSDEQIESWRRRMLNVIRRSCPAWLPMDAEDLAQDAVLKLVNMVKQGEMEHLPPPSYINKVAYHALVDAIRSHRARRSKEVPMEVHPQPLPDRTDRSDPERRSLARRIGAGIQECLMRLTGKRREAVTLYLQEHTIPEIGEVMGWTLTQANNLVYRGLKGLRACLQEKGFEP